MKRWRVMAGISALALAGCGASAPDVLFPPSQSWGDVDVRIETRPEVPTVGFTEFLVLATERQPKRPVHDLIVSIRLADTAPWTQAIQDGAIGVYRRSLKVTDPAREKLAVRLERGERQTVLQFDLPRLAPGPM